LADDVRPRLSGSEAARRAVDYCQGVFRNYGLTNIHLEPFEIPGWFPGPALAEAVEPISKNLKVETLGLSINTPPQGLVSEVIDVGHGSEEDFEKWGPAIRGKIVLAGLKTPADHSKATKESQKVYYSTQKGAAACLIVSGTPGGLTRTRAAVYGDYSSIPAAFITYEDGTWLRRRLEDGKPVKIRLLIQNRLPGPILAENVVAEIKGQEKPEEIVIFGTHLDSWFLGPGAADNSLGVSIALETARVLSRPDFRLRRTVRFVLFCGEEQGSLGSFEYVKNHEATGQDRVDGLRCNGRPRSHQSYGTCAMG
jgi:hypothetical protein